LLTLSGTSGILERDCFDGTVGGAKLNLIFKGGSSLRTEILISKIGLPSSLFSLASYFTSNFNSELKGVPLYRSLYSLSKPFTDLTFAVTIFLSF
jgi:hypothetical protein